MKDVIFFFIISTFSLFEINAQNPAIVPDNIPGAYIDYIFSNDEIFEATELYKSQVPKFEIPINANAPKEDLYLDIYYHQIQNSLCLSNSPLIIFAPASGNNRLDVKYIARDLARRGYVVASITTRHASDIWLLLNYLNINKSNTHPLLTYTAATDLHSAINYLVTQRSSVYQFDPNYVIVAGGSFGAITALHAAFMDKTEANNLFGTLTNVNSSYFNDFSESIQNNNIKGVLSLYGGIYDLSMIKATESKPVFMFHGNRDPYVPYKTNSFYYTSGNVMISGSAVIAEKLKNNNSSYSLSIGDNVGHTYKPTCGYLDNSFPSGYPMNWYPDMLSFIKSSILCNNLNQQQKIINCTSPECSTGATTPANCREMNSSSSHIANSPSSYSTIFLTNTPFVSCIPSTINEHCHVFSFDGGDYIKINSSSSLNSTESNAIDFWYKKSGTIPNNKINILYSSGIDNNINNSRLTIGLIGENQLWVYAKNPLSTNSISQIINTAKLDEDWHHFTIAFFNTTLIVSIDSWANQFTISSPFLININNCIHYFGGTNYTSGTTSLPYTNSIGQIDNIRFWINVPDPQGVGTMNIVNTGTDNICPTNIYLAGYWKLNSDGQTIKDETNNHNDGTKGASISIESSDPTYVSNCNTSARTSAPTNSNNLNINNEDTKKTTFEKTEILTIFPNPSTSKPTILFLSPVQGTADIQLLNSKGDEIINLVNFNLTKDLNFISDFLPNLSNGIYFIKITTKQKSHEEKFIIIK